MGPYPINSVCGLRYTVLQYIAFKSWGRLYSFYTLKYLGTTIQYMICKICGRLQTFSALFSKCWQGCIH